MACFCFISRLKVNYACKDNLIMRRLQLQNVETTGERIKELKNFFKLNNLTTLPVFFNYFILEDMIF